MRYNGYPAIEISGAPAPGFSSGQAEALMQKLADEHLPKGIALEWTELTYQKILAGNTGLWVYPLSILLVFLVLAAQYESFRLPFAIILIVPMALFSAMLGLWLTQRRQQHLHADRPDRAHRPRGEERDPDRRVRGEAPGGRRDRSSMPRSKLRACGCVRS